MKRIFNNYISLGAIIILLVLFLSSCKTKEKVAEKQLETVHVVSSTSAAQAQQSELFGRTATTEATSQIGWSDSIVEKFHERIVTDSTGRVLLHEVDRHMDTYKGKKQSQTKYEGQKQENTTAQDLKQNCAMNDSIYNINSVKKLTIVKKKSWRWLWFVGLLVSLVVVGFITSKFRR